MGSILLRLPVASCCFLLHPVASCCFLLLPVASCCFLLLPVASCCFLLLRSCLLLVCRRSTHTPRHELPPSPAVSRCLPMSTTRLSLLPNHHPKVKYGTLYLIPIQSLFNPYSNPIQSLFNPYLILIYSATTIHRTKIRTRPKTPRPRTTTRQRNKRAQARAPTTAARTRRCRRPGVRRRAAALWRGAAAAAATRMA